MFTGSGDNIARVYDAKTAVLKRSFKGHTYSVNCLTVSITVLVIIYIKELRRAETEGSWKLNEIIRISCKLLVAYNILT